MRQTIINKQRRLAINPRHKTPFIRIRRKKGKGNNKRITDVQNAKRKRKQRKTTFEPAAAVGGTSSMDMFHIVISLVPFYPVCRLLSTFVDRGPFYSSCCPPFPHALGRVSFHSSCWPSSLHSLGHHSRRIRGASYSQLCLILIPPHHEPFGCFEDPSVPLPCLFSCAGPQRGLKSKHQGGNFR